ncbi:MAG: pyridoxal phosphate-dependent aminotransferase [Candidatus Electronema sp. V4]|uniref:pyridoxal phosphate-dependent aminotransferase n=1 Tax=Candidatus Electronema sp. V4 TaxID=3454756 RepID=UPI0040558D21
MLRVKPQIAALSTYKPPWSHIDRTAYLRFDLNENTLPLPGCVKAALHDFIDSDRIPLYPDCAAFLPKLARYVGTAPELLLVTNGSDQGIEVVLRSFLGEGDELVMAQPGFPMFGQIAGVIGAKIKGVPYTSDLRFPRREFFAAVSPATKLIVLVNPDNPTGVAISLDVIEEALALRPDLPVLVDEAYFEFTGATALPLLEKYPNLIILRTFSKAFALGGLRFGHIIAQPDLITEFSKVRGPFDVNTCALTAAEAQLDDPAATWRRFPQEAMQLAKPYLEAFLKENKVKQYPGAAHFMLVEPEDRDGAVAFLKARGILVRPMVAPAIKTCFRMNVGTLEQTKHFAEVYADYLRQQR